jgi:hypothetical protein
VTKPDPDWFSPKTKEVVTFIAGLSGLVWQTAAEERAQTILVTAFVAMIFGSPFISKFLDKFGGGGQQ